MLLNCGVGEDSEVPWTARISNQSTLKEISYRLYPARILCSWNLPGKNTGAGCHFLLQGIFLTQGWNPQGSPPLLRCQTDSLSLSHQGSPVLKVRIVGKILS